MGSYCYGIDVGGTTIKCGLFKTDGTLIEKWEIPTRTENNGEQILPDIAKEILFKNAQLGIDKEDVEGIGVGIPGPVNDQGAVEMAVNLFWGYKDLSKELEEMTGIRAKAGNDANVAALGEVWKGAAEGTESAIMVTLGTGVGGGIILNGEIVAGKHGAGGEIGHACMEHDEDEPCNCGNYGCLEQYTSATGLVRMARKELKLSEDPSTLREVEELTAKDILDAYKAGDDLATRVMDHFGDRLGGALAIFACVMDPEVIVIGGGVSKAGQPLIDCIQKFYRKYAFPMCKNTPLVLARLGNDAGIYGSARMVIRRDR